MDLRTYHNLFIPTRDEVTGFRRLKLLAGSRWVPETQLGNPIPDDSIVAFYGIRGYLAPSLEYQELVRKELLQIVRTEHKKAIKTGFSPSIALHVRLGDFGAGNHAEGNSRLDISWYIGILKRLRENLGMLPASVFSDGTDEELAPLLALDRVTRASFGSSIADIIGLSRARILITSGSTLSMWASFLGQMPTVWYPGRLYHPILKDTRREIETHLEISAEFTEQCLDSLQRNLIIAPEEEQGD
jgi:hypothetical protein